MKRVLTVIFLLGLACGLLAQTRGAGNILGIVVDDQNNPLPGVSVTLSGATIRPTAAVTNAEGKFRFMALFPGNDYALKLELQGFKSRTETGVIVNINLTPVVQAKKVQVTHTVNYDQLQSLPGSRDPWFVLQMAPALFVDRENMAGAESGQMAAFMHGGTTWNDWSMDGVQTTDLASLSSAGYYDFDAFEEMNVSTGQLDVENRRLGVVINLVSRRGGNKTSVAGRFYLTDKNFQSKISDADLVKINVPGYNRVNEIKDYGINIGGPVIKDRIWWWGAYGVQNIKTFVPTGKDDSDLTNYNIKLNFQIISQNRAEFQLSSGKKEKFGRSSTYNFPSGYNQYGTGRFGNPSWKFIDEHMFGDDMFATFRFGLTKGGFKLIPANNEEISKVVWYDQEKDLYQNSYSYSDYKRPHLFMTLQAQYFNDDLLGGSHEMKLGVELNNNTNFSTGHWPGNFYIRTNYYTQTVDWDLNGTRDVVRDLFKLLPGNPKFNYVSFDRNSVEVNEGTERIAAYFSDNITFGRFNLNLGLRVDRDKEWRDERVYRALWTQDDSNLSRSNYYEVTNSIITPDTVQKIAALLPEKSHPALTQNRFWIIFSPRVGLTYDLFGTGKTILKAGYSLYPGGGLGNSGRTFSGLGGSFNFYWADLNNDNMMRWDELYWYDPTKSNRPVYKPFDANGDFIDANMDRQKGYTWSGFDWYNKMGMIPSYTTYDFDNFKVSLTHEISLSIEQELMKDFGVQLNYSYRRYGRYAWSRSWYPADKFPGISEPNHIRSQSDYMIGGYVPDKLVTPTGTAFDTKQAKGRPWYVLKNLDICGYTDYSYYTMAPSNYYDDFWGIDLVFTKRLSNKWMLNGSATYQMQKVYWGDAYTDPTNKWAYSDTIYTMAMGGTSGKVDQAYFSKWMFKLAGMYQLPWDLNISGTFSAHEGGWIAQSFGISDTTLPNTRSQSNSLPTTIYEDRVRLPNVFTVDLKIEKMIRVSDGGRIYFSADVFNAFNNRVVLRQYGDSYGSFRMNDGYWAAPGVNNLKPNEIMNPLVFRFGVRFQI
jgi:hypothetical protein